MQGATTTPNALCLLDAFRTIYHEFEAIYC
jgi:hypothetical protein